MGMMEFVPYFVLGTSLTVVTCAVAFQVYVNFRIKRKVDKNSKEHGGSLVAAVLRSHGVEYMFTLVGGHISPILVAAEKEGIRIVDTRHEASAVFAADASARLTGKIGVVAVTAGPGLTNTVTAVKNAQMAESPLLLIGGAAATILKGRGALQDIDQMSLFKTTCKYCTTVTTVRDIVPVLKKAINIAMTGVPGPVFVEFPVDTLYPYHIVQKEVLGGQSPNSMSGRITQWYLDMYVGNLFASAWEPRDLNPLPVITPLPDPKLVKKAEQMLRKSKQPLILVGSQAMLKPDQVGQLERAIKKIGVPTYLGGMARGLLGRKNNIHMRHARSEALRKADFVLLAGTVCDFRLSYGRVLPKKAKIVSVNRDRKQASKNSGTFWSPSLIVECDVSTFIVQLASLITGYKCDDNWLEELSLKDFTVDKRNRDLSYLHVGEFLNPLHVLFELEKSLPDNSILIADGGDFVGTAAYILRPRGPLRWLDPGAFGTLGVGGGFAIGAKVACPEAEVWIIYGDGSCGYSIAEFDTFIRHKLPVIAVVGNDAGWTQIEREQKPMFGSSVACVLAHTHYHIVAQGFGAEGLMTSCRAPCPAKIFKAAHMFYSCGRSVLVNALIGKTNFRDGSIAV